MSEYLAGPQGDGAGNAGPAGRADRRTSHVDESRPVDGDREHVRFGIPFNGVVPIWHDDATITWHRPADGTAFNQRTGKINTRAFYREHKRRNAFFILHIDIFNNRLALHRVGHSFFGIGGRLGVIV